MADLQGPKIRIGKFAEGRIKLAPGSDVRARRRVRRSATSTQRRPRLQGAAATTCAMGDTLLLDDGLIVLGVAAVEGSAHPHRGRAGRPALQQQGHQSQGRRPDRAGADRQGHAGHQDRGDAQGRFPRRVVPAARGRHAHGARALRNRGRPRAPGREDRARRSDHRARRDHSMPPTASWWRAAISPWKSARQRAGSAEAHDPAGAGEEPARHHRDADDGIHDRQPHSRRARKSPTWRTRCSTAPTR